MNFFLGYIHELTDAQRLRDFVGTQKFDVVFGGPPCQGFSYSGKRCQQDSRNRLFLAFLRVVALLQPQYFVMENVEGILSYSFKEFYTDDGRLYENTAVSEIIRKEAELIGYGINIKLLNARNFGVPQNRPRVIFLGHRVDFTDETKRDLVLPPKLLLKLLDCVCSTTWKLRGNIIRAMIITLK